MPTLQEIQQEIRRRQEAARKQMLDPSDYQGIPEADKIRTADEAQQRAEENTLALEDGPAHMELAKEMLNPVDLAMGGLPFISAPIRKGMSAAGEVAKGVSKAAARPLELAAEKQLAIDITKDPARLEPYARGLVEDAAEKINSGIGSKEKTLKELIKGKQGEMNPDVVSEIAPKYGQRLAERRLTPVTRDVPTGIKYNEIMSQDPLELQQTVKGAQRIAEPPTGQVDMFKGPDQMPAPYDAQSFQPKPDTVRDVKVKSPEQSFDWQEQYGFPLKQTVMEKAPSGNVPVDLENILRIKRMGDKLKNYSFTDAMNPSVVAKAKNASRASDVARAQLYKNAPGSEELLGAMGKDIRLKNYLTGKGAKNPVSAIQASPGTLKSSVLAQIDNAAGTRLAEKGQQLIDAKKSLIEPKNLTRPLKAPSELFKIGERGVTAVGSGLNKLGEKASNLFGKVPMSGEILDRSAFSGAKSLGSDFMHDMQGAQLGATEETDSPQASTQPSQEDILGSIKEELLRRKQQKQDNNNGF